MNNLLGKGAVIPDEKRIIFLGDSITDDGTYIAHMKAYFIRHIPYKKLEFINLGVSSETVCGLSEPDHPFPRPCVHDRLDKALYLSKPDWVVICYGMNDGIYYPFSEERFSLYKNGMLSLIEKVRSVGAKIILMTPPPFDGISLVDSELLPEGSEKYSYLKPFKHYDQVMKRYGERISSELRQVVDMVIDIYNPLRKYIDGQREINAGFVYGDGIHPGVDGHWIIARELLKALFNISLERVPDYVHNHEASNMFKLLIQHHRIISAAWKEHVGHTNPNKAATLPLEEAKILASKHESELLQMVNNETGQEAISIWKGYKRRDIYYNGREAIVIQPEKPVPGKPWIWRTEFFDAFSYADMEMLAKGWHLVYYRISDMYGCPEATGMMKEFQSFAVNKFDLAERAVLFGFSRGGLYAFNYAAEYPKSVAAIYLDAPVLNICSWPGGKWSGIGAAKEWEECLNIYGLDESTVNDFKGNPINYVEAFSAAGIPVIIVAGDADDVVPFSENSAILAACLERMGAKVKLIVKNGIGHHPHSLENPMEIVEFIISNTFA